LQDWLGSNNPELNLIIKMFSNYKIVPYAWVGVDRLRQTRTEDSLIRFPVAQLFVLLFDL